MTIDLYAPAYPLIAVLAALLFGFIFGRVTGGRNDPRRIEAKRREAQAYDLEVRQLSTKLSPKASMQARQHISKNEILQAIKIFREDTGCGLKEAKDAVERMQGRST